MFSVSMTAARLGVCTKIIRRWDKKGLIECYRTPGNHRRIPVREIARILHGTSPQKTPPTHPAVYARVSSHRQKAAGDLKRQVEELCQHCSTPPKVFKDVGSGLNMHRRGLWRLLTEAKKGTISSVYITHRDRLAHFYPEEDSF
ncbi:MAG: DNA binding domain-containing protein, excisionase family [Candidatus Thorarchaeota archaeon]|nr:MAG: DNA binding domain-containing protein, excisionase family [Candidatus Thorarchaeota archaeon]